MQYAGICIWIFSSRIYTLKVTLMFRVYTSTCQVTTKSSASFSSYKSLAIWIAFIIYFFFMISRCMHSLMGHVSLWKLEPRMKCFINSCSGNLMNSRNENFPRWAEFERYISKDRHSHLFCLQFGAEKSCIQSQSYFHIG